ncbi:MAG: hypothetical protein UU12_C0039G0004 [Candidatus Woesebacteria bacterium GW2011_GWA2_40_7b]|uniref:Uncharacterized protein n=1 Tax=Candidatus Woesebacteria bacterium GW2011_GWA2_40_7b TaxID=1618563 RepID=A0A0G0W341_9BACT|nr:MAG: hypothetical protein UU12_C0039G0004 [Candidatus Woesebacteria bacterium GW2011_GWA2_40_7b]
MKQGWRGQYYRYRGYFLDILNLYKKRSDLRAFVEVILSISTVTIFLVFALKPTALTIISLVKEIKGKQTAISGLNQKISDLSKAQALFIQNQDFISNIDIAVETKPEPDTITKQIIGLSVKNSVNILGLSIGQVSLIGKPVLVNVVSGSKPLPGNAQEMSVSINIQGDYLNMLSFISDFESLRIASKIDLVGINSSEADGAKVINMLVSARIPFLGNGLP